MMFKNLFFSLLFFVSGNIFAQQNQWAKVSDKNIVELRDRGSRVSKFELFNLNSNDFKNLLSKAPNRDTTPISKGVFINFPNTNGNYDTYEVLESSNFHPDLQNKYQEIKSYMGMKVGDPLSTVRFTYDPYFGLSASFKTTDGIFFIESYTKNNNIYLVYNRKDAVSNTEFQCMVDEDIITNEINTSSDTNKTVEDGLIRRYRLAITTSVEYSNYMITQAGVSTGTDAQKKAAILAGVNLAVARLNQVFENDISSRLILIPNTDLLFFLTTDTFDVTSTNQMLGENITVTNTIIGSANYDLGHIFYSGGGGGLAATPSVCGNSKAGGVTGTGTPVGDPFVIDYVAHEMGHQFGANHTQNNACNRSANTSVEPGSGSTIMSYSGICAPNVQSNSDAVFNAISVKEMYTRITGGGNCALNLPSGNTKPTADVGMDKTIPKETPFALTTIATDPNGDVLTYTYDQMDKEVASMPPSPASSIGPMFRSILPSVSNTRYFPRLKTIVQGYDPTISNQGDFRAWEKLPAVSRILNFAALVRDNNPYGGQTARDDIKITVTASAGPFVVTSQNVPGVIWNLGASETITWNVANTTAAPVSTANVSIHLSNDNGVTFPITLVDSTPNDGSYTFTVPKNLGIIDNNARIMIKAIDNVFLNVNKTAFTIKSTVPPVRSEFSYPEIIVYPVPSYDGFVYLKGLAEYDTTYSVYAIDGKLIIPKKTLALGDIYEKIDMSEFPTGTYLIKIENETGSFTKKLIMVK